MALPRLGTKLECLIVTAAIDQNAGEFLEAEIASVRTEILRIALTYHANIHCKMRCFTCCLQASGLGRKLKERDGTV